MPAFTTVRNFFVDLMITFLVHAFTFISSKSSPYILSSLKRKEKRKECLLTFQSKIQTQKGSNERLFILTRAQYAHFPGNPLNLKISLFLEFSSFLTVYLLFKCRSMA